MNNLLALAGAALVGAIVGSAVGQTVTGWFNGEKSPAEPKAAAKDKKGRNPEAAQAAD